MVKVNRRIIGIIVLVLSLIFSIASLGFGQQYTLVADVFYKSYVNAESFDAYVDKNRALFDSDFHSCLDSIYQQYFPIGAAHAKQCSNMAGVGQDYMQCIQSNTAAGIIVWIENIRMVLQGKSLWKDTPVGGPAIRSIVMIRELGDPYLLNIVLESQKTIMRQMMPSLYCTKY